MGVTPQTEASIPAWKKVSEKRASCLLGMWCSPGKICRDLPLRVLGKAVLRRCPPGGTPVQHPQKRGCCGHSTRTPEESRITRQKGKTNDKHRKFKERIQGKKKQKPGAVRERKGRGLCFQRVTPRHGHPLEAPDPYGSPRNLLKVRQIPCPKTISELYLWYKATNQKTDHNNSPPSDLPRSPSCLHPLLISEGYLRPCWKTKMHESHPKLNGRFEPVLQGGRGLNAFGKLQSTYPELLPLEVKNQSINQSIKSPLESIYPEIRRKTACGTKDNEMAHCWEEERRVLTHNMVKFGCRTLVVPGGQASRLDGFPGTAHGQEAQKKRRNKIPFLTYNLVRSGLRTLLGAQRAAGIFFFFYQLVDLDARFSACQV
ncbi:unnamed protein product [Nyctereutes procyonoides]|uniref:(raccoon dog) hypothetical protein n=1 Tax=Nyctereutes procyonoides TaxID=34880 RepID=A0A811ZMB7_NYCPR|nr:unnamed protein product [Nyctereutes procyonoides]